MATVDEAGNVLEYYVRGLGLLAVIRPSGVRYVHSDGNGSTRALTDENATVTDRYRYSAFGEMVEHTGNDDLRFLFVGEHLEPESGLYDLRARWLDPATGRFLSVDPFPASEGAPKTLHRYVYAGNDPVNQADPTGL